MVLTVHNIHRNVHRNIHFSWHLYITLHLYEIYIHIVSPKVRPRISKRVQNARALLNWFAIDMGRVSCYSLVCRARIIPIIMTLMPFTFYSVKKGSVKKKVLGPGQDTIGWNDNKSFLYISRKPMYSAKCHLVYDHFGPALSWGTPRHRCYCLHLTNVFLIKN